MATTALPQDKHAFLFTGPTVPQSGVTQYMADIGNVYRVLTEFYNYPPANITLAFGSALPPTYAFPGSTVVAIATPGDLAAALSTFAAACAPAPGAPPLSTTALLYFTGGADGPTAGNPSPTYNLVIDGGSGSNNVSPAWFAAQLSAFAGCQAQVVMQQPYADRYLPAGLPAWSFTSASTGMQSPPVDCVNGGYFTQGWAQGLRLEPLPGGAFADTLGPGSEATDLLVSLREASLYAGAVQETEAALFGDTVTPLYADSGSPQLLGLPSFLVRDGASQWSESPDIYLTHPNAPAVPPGWLFIPDPAGPATGPYNNTVNVDVRNVGTHPVRQYALGVEIFQMPAGALLAQQTFDAITPATPTGVLQPILPASIGTGADLKDTVPWNTPFSGSVHRCAMAEAVLLASEVDFVWNILADDFEAQANLDPMPIAPLGPERILTGLRGQRLHRYTLSNRFPSRRAFFLVFPPGYEQLAPGIQLTWRDVGKDGGAGEPLAVVDKPARYIPFTLNAGEARDVVIEVQLARNLGSDVLRLPFEIVAEVEPRELDQARDAGGTIRRPAVAAIARATPKGVAAIAGVTIVVQHGAVTLTGRALDAAGKPRARAPVTLRTTDGLQQGVVTTDAEGRYVFAAINPDVYVISTEMDGRCSPERVIALFAGAHEVLDLSHDPLRF